MKSLETNIESVSFANYHPFRDANGWYGLVEVVFGEDMVYSYNDHLLSDCNKYVIKILYGGNNKYTITVKTNNTPEQLLADLRNKDKKWVSISRDFVESESITRIEI